VIRAGSLDPFADSANDLPTTQDAGAKPDIHIRIQQRNGRKTLTTLQGLPSEVRLICRMSVAESTLTSCARPV
jgi:translation initiation factor SUI1